MSLIWIGRIIPVEQWMDCIWVGVHTVIPCGGFLLNDALFPVAAIAPLCLCCLSGYFTFAGVICLSFLCLMTSASRFDEVMCNTD